MGYPPNPMLRPRVKGYPLTRIRIIGLGGHPYATGSVSLGSAEEPYDSDMTQSYRLTEGRLIRYPQGGPSARERNMIGHAYSKS